jgi:hypothetical protein
MEVKNMQQLRWELEDSHFPITIRDKWMIFTLASFGKKCGKKLYIDDQNQWHLFMSQMIVKSSGEYAFRDIFCSLFYRYTHWYRLFKKAPVFLNATTDNDGSLILNIEKETTGIPAKPEKIDLSKKQFKAK